MGIMGPNRTGRARMPHAWKCAAALLLSAAITAPAIAGDAMAAAPEGGSAGGNIGLAAGAPASGQGWSWDGALLALDGYSGPGFAFPGDARMTVSGDCSIRPAAGLAGLECPGALNIDGGRSGMLSIRTDEAFCIDTWTSLTLKDIAVDISSEAEEDATAVMVYVHSPELFEFGRELRLSNVTGTVAASCAEGQAMAVDTTVRGIVLEDTEADREIGTLDFGNGVSLQAFVKGRGRTFTDDDAFDAAAAPSVALKGTAPVRRKKERAIVAGQEADLRALLFPGGAAEGATGCILAEKGMKRTARIKKKWTVKGRRPGTVKVQAVEENTGGYVTGGAAETYLSLDPYEVIAESELTVLSRPKLRFPKMQWKGEQEVLDGYAFFRTADTLLTAADRWESSAPAVAGADPRTGAITVKGPGRARITAWFGNLPVRARLRVSPG